MTYTTLEELVGEFLEEPGAVGSGWTRYTQARRRQAIARAELEMARFMPIDKLPKLVAIKNDIVSTVSAGIGSIAKSALPQDLMDVIELWDDASAYPLVFREMKEPKARMRKNLNLKNSYGWYWGDDGVLHFFAPAAYVTTAQDIRYKRYPNSYDLSKTDKGTTWQWMYTGAITGGALDTSAGNTITGGTSGSIGTIKEINSGAGNKYIFYTLTSGTGFIAGETITFVAGV